MPTSRALRHALAVLLLPGVVVVLVPALIVSRTDSVSVGWGLNGALDVLPVMVGGVLVAVGAGFVSWTISLFVREGRGTLAPWDPTSRLVVRGPYRYVRNPMISGVLFILLGESVLLGSVPVLVWFGLVAALNAIYLPLVEEPGLVRRYGVEYERYRASVPRWLPRRHARDDAEEGPQPPP